MSPHALSTRERQVAGALAQGNSVDAVAKRFKIASNTVIAHRRRIYLKTGCHSLHDLVRWALREGVLTREALLLG